MILKSVLAINRESEQLKSSGTRSQATRHIALEEHGAQSLKGFKLPLNVCFCLVIRHLFRL